MDVLKIAAHASEMPDEPVENDRDAQEIPRPQPTTDFLLPEGGIIGVDRFSLVVSRNAFAGWVAQPSPCCGAASVAGAANAAIGIGHDAPAAISHAHVCAIYHGILAEQAVKKAAGIARLIGVASIDPALDALRTELALDGLSLGGRKEKACKGKEAMARLTAVAAASLTQHEGEEGEEARMWSALWEVLEPLHVAAAAGGGGGATGGPLEEVNHHFAASAEGKAAVVKEREGGKEGGDEPEDDEEAGGGEASAAGDKYDLKVRKELKLLLSKLGGMEQLAPELDRPCTWFIGNWGMSAAIRALRGPAFDAAGEMGEVVDPRMVSLCADAHDTGRAQLCAQLRCRTLVGLRCKGSPPPPIQLKKGDGEEAIEAAWLALKAAFSTARTCMILHQKGHYALMFAMRDWVDGDEAAEEHADGHDVDAYNVDGHAEGRRVRQILTCRKGQRPTTWVDWREVHGYITGWNGYAIIEVSAV